MHESHTDLPGYHPDQVLFDHCPECEHRGQEPLLALSRMDPDHFAKAWARAWAWNDQRTEGDVQPTVSAAERATLSHLYRIQVLLERNCGVPMGTLPVARVRPIR